MNDTQEATDYELACAFARGPGQAFRFSANPTGAGGSWEHDTGTGWRFENDVFLEAALLEFLETCSGVRIQGLRLHNIVRMLKARLVYRGRKA